MEISDITDSLIKASDSTSSLEVAEIMRLKIYSEQEVRDSVWEYCTNFSVAIWHINKAIHQLKEAKKSKDRLEKGVKKEGQTDE